MLQFPTLRRHAASSRVERPAARALRLPQRPGGTPAARGSRAVRLRRAQLCPLQRFGAPARLPQRGGPGGRSRRRRRAGAGRAGRRCTATRGDGPAGDGARVDDVAWLRDWVGEPARRRLALRCRLTCGRRARGGRPATEVRWPRSPTAPRPSRGGGCPGRTSRSWRRTRSLASGPRAGPADAAGPARRAARRVARAVAIAGWCTATADRPALRHSASGAVRQKTSSLGSGTTSFAPHSRVYSSWAEISSRRFHGRMRM